MRSLRFALRLLVAAVFALTVAATTEFGPVVMRLAAYHGVHVGDLLAVLMALAWAVLGNPERSRARGESAGD